MKGNVYDAGVNLTQVAIPKNLDDGNVIHTDTVKEFYIKAAAEEPLPTDPAPNASWR